MILGYNAELDYIDDVSTWYERELLSSQEAMTSHAVTGLQTISEHTSRHLQVVPLLWRRGFVDQHWCIPGFHLHYLQ